MTCRRNSSRHPDRKAKATFPSRTADLVQALAGASGAHDAELIAGLLTDDVQTLIDSGGAVLVGAHGARGRRPSVNLILQILSSYSRLSCSEHEINGGSGILLKDDDVLVGVMNVEMRDGAISRIWVVLNPEKLVRFDVG